MEDIHRATRRYEEWLGGLHPARARRPARQAPRMGEGPFFFMRATFYRWCQLWRARARKELGDAARGGARSAAVGDLHLENFGTWRDSDGRLIWGINDFDETTTAPLDAGSGAPRGQRAPGDLRRPHRRAAARRLRRDPRGLPRRRRGGRAAVRARGDARLAPARRHGRAAPPDDVLGENERAAHRARRRSRGGGRHHRRDAGGAICRSASPAAWPGLGSLGRPRFVGIADWHGGARRARGEGDRAVGLGLGDAARPPTERDRYTRSSPAPSASPIRPFRSSAAGWCGASRPTARASSSAICRRAATRSGCSSRWGSRPRTSTSGRRASARSCASRSPPAAGAGCTRPPRSWPDEMVREWKEWRAA